MVLTEISGFYLRGRKQFYGKNPTSSKGDRNTEKYKYPCQEPIQTEQEIRLASLHDIGAMKLSAIFQNGTRIKDFVDMHFLLEHHPLKTYLDAYQNKYNGNPALASHFLLHHENIDHEEKVKLLREKETN